MKKHVKKLVVDRQTVRNLQANQLAAVDGGAPPTYNANCPISYFDSCKQFC